jgi:peptidyl-dipeptidase A
METGSSENWRDTLSLAIGENRLDGSALREFFQPLEEWLRNENLRTEQFIGWTYGMLYYEKCLMLFRYFFWLHIF